MVTGDNNVGFISQTFGATDVVLKENKIEFKFNDDVASQLNKIKGTRNVGVEITVSGKTYAIRGLCNFN